jgi:hypothetical protein
MLMTNSLMGEHPNHYLKAWKLAASNQVKIDYQAGEFHTLHYRVGEFDGIALIYAHFPAKIKSAIHQLLDQYLKEGYRDL